MLKVQSIAFKESFFIIAPKVMQKKQKTTLFIKKDFKISRFQSGYN
jgi:hypothetical protein